MSGRLYGGKALVAEFIATTCFSIALTNLRSRMFEANHGGMSNARGRDLGHAGILCRGMLGYFTYLSKDEQRGLLVYPIAGHISHIESNLFLLKVSV